MAEWRLQPRFIKWLILLVFLALANDSRPEWPDRVPLPFARAAVRYALLDIGGDAGGGVRITGAWQVTAGDPRMGGLSGLAVTGSRTLVAVTDSGVLVDLPEPGFGHTARVRDLPSGPGPATFKKYRDSEAMLVDPDGLGRSVTFENRHSLWRFERDGGSFAFRLPSRGWATNKGIEAMVEESSTRALLLLPEAGNQLWRFAGPAGKSYPLTGTTGGIADAARLPDGRIVVAVREVGLLGLSNRLAWLERSGGAYRLRNFATLPLGPLDNVEGLAAEPRPGGGAILWAVTDNDGWRRTLLLRMEIAPP